MTQVSCKKLTTREFGVIGNVSFYGSVTDARVKYLYLHLYVRTSC